MTDTPLSGREKKIKEGELEYKDSKIVGPEAIPAMGKKKSPERGFRGF
jgi:hypothetical protein